MKKLLDFINDKKECTGCSACINICPTNCIQMIADEEGFDYPYYETDDCISCNRCLKVCPIAANKTQGEILQNQQVLTFRTKNKNVWKCSSSGGAFTEICKGFEDQETYIFGAQMEGLSVLHSCVLGSDNIEVFRKSKYVQSQVGKTFVTVKKILKSGKKVIYSGTPCQIAGLKSYLGKSYDNLLLIDFICHGVGSPEVFREAVKEIGVNKHTTITSYKFRQKRKKLGKTFYFISVYFHNDHEIIAYNKKNDLYLNLFLSQLCLRRSCQENCAFRQKERLSDITIADYKGGVVKNKYGIIDYKNYSSVIFNTQKGLSIKDYLSKHGHSYTCSLEELEAMNPLFFHTTTGNKMRDSFFKEYVKRKNLMQLAEKYTGYKYDAEGFVEKQTFFKRIKAYFYFRKVFFNNIVMSIIDSL